MIQLTLHELSQFIYLKKEIETEKMRLMALENTTQSETNSPAFIKQNINLETVQQILDCKRTIEKHAEQSILEHKKLSEYIAKIEDIMLRRIITLRFIQGMSWVHIALELGGGNSPDGVRMMVKRYLSKQD